MRATQVTAPVTWHGEGPFWDAARKRLLVVDMLAGTIVDLASFEHPARYGVGSPVAAVVRRRAAGGYIVATERGFTLFDEDFAVERRLPDVFSDSTRRLNEGGCDPQGRFYCGSMAYDEAQGAASVYRLQADGSASTVLRGVTISNGLQWSLDGSLAYYIDTPTRRIDVFDFDGSDGSFHDRRPFARIEDGIEGWPDGMAIDADGGLWVALWGGGAVLHYDASGRQVDRVEVPGVTNTSAVAFGGAGRDTLYITTSRQHLADGAEPGAGSVFAAQPGVRGAPLHDFGG